MELNDVDFEPEYDDVVEVPQNEPFEFEDSTNGDEGGSSNGSFPDGNSSSGGGSAEIPDNKGDVMTGFLKFNGISDPDHIKFEDEDGIIKEKSWNDLSYEEKMNILTTSYQQPERDLDDAEISFINELRSKNLDPKQYIETIRQQAVKDYTDAVGATPQLKVSDLSDDEIFLLDLQDKIEDATDEELVSALEKAKENPLYQKQVAGIRKSLEAQEASYLKQQEVERAQLEEDQFNQFRDSVVNSIQSFNKVGDLDINLEREDMEDLASFILDKDDTGMSYMGKALNDPHTLVEMAWWTLKGRDALNNISEYFSNEIKNVRQMSYQKGLEDGKKGSSRVLYKPREVGTPTTRNGSEVTIDDIYG